MLVYKNIGEFVRQVIHPFSNNLRLLIDDAQQRIDDTIKLIESIKKEILQLIDTIRDQLIDLSTKHDKDVEDLNDRCDQIVNDYQQADKNVTDHVDDVISKINTKIEQVITHSGAVTQTFTILGTIGGSAHGCIIKTGTITKIGFVSSHSGGFNINMFLANGDGSNRVNIGRAYYYGRGLNSYVYAYNIPVTEGQNITFNIAGNYPGEGMISATIWIQ